ncbi:MAG: BrnT family toxin [bacterium]|nr:BrnT family toxin [bacterium]
MNYQWDPQKAASNLQKHKIDFADAIGVFEDEWGLTLREDVIEGEQRFVTLGRDFLNRVVVVAYTHRGDSIRIISARRSTRRERKVYEQKRI